MRLKETAFAYNLTTQKHSNSDWGAEIGQGKKKLMSVDGVSDILNGMLYYKVDNINDITASLGKNNHTLKPLGDYLPETSIVVASLFDKVSLNGELLDGEKFIMFVTRDERKENSNGEVNLQYLRRSLKFPDKAEYKGQPYNRKCFEAISQKLGCTSNGSWIVTDMNFVDDALDFKAFAIDNNNPYDFKNKIERSKILNRIKNMESMKEFKPSKYTGELSPIILYGPPGTGKTNRMQENYISKFDNDNRYLTTFHQSFSYEEFVEGLKPVLSDEDDGGEIKYKVMDGIFKQACERAANMAGYASLNDCLEDTCDNRKEKFDKAIKEHKTVLLCIDEINRGNVAAIFGDLISLIETSKRLGADHELTAILPYSKITFGVPKNLLVVGTMNTADRSIQLLDSALRRRFKFEEIGPNYDVFGATEVQQNAKKILQNINAKIRCLLNKDNQIGHSYFMFAKSYDDIYDALTKKIIPLLEEYFYNDVDKIRFVLNESDKNKNKNSFYIKDEEAIEAYKIYSKDNFDEEDKVFYSLRTERPTDCETFLKHLYETKKNDAVDEQE